MTMQAEPVTADDEALVAAARDLINARVRENRHHIAAAVRTTDGRIYLGLHLDTYVGRASVCAEAVAVGAAMADGATGITAIVSVRHPKPTDPIDGVQIVSPCGICREMLTDFAPDARVIMRQGGELGRFKATELLPEKYRRKTAP